MVKYCIVITVLFSISAAQEWKHYTTSNSGIPSDLVYALVNAPDNTLWVGTGIGIASLKEGVWTVYDTTNSPLPDPYVTCLAVDSSNALWIGTGFAGAAKLQNGNWIVYDTSNSDIPHNTIYDITIGPDQSPWFATNDGVVNLNGNVWTNLKSKMIEPRSRSVAFDRKGVLWMGTYDPTDFRGYIEYMQGDSFTHTILSKLDIISTHAKTMMPVNDSTMLVGTGNGLAEVVNGVWTIYHKQDSPLPANGIASLALIGDTVIIGTASGIAERVNGAWNVILPSSGGLPNSVVTAIAVDRNGNRWLATGNSGIAVYKNGGIAAQPQPETAQPKNFILYQNYPNPFNPGTTIRYHIPHNGFTSLKVYDIIGREAVMLVNEFKEAGEYSVYFNAERLVTGVYVAKLTYGSSVQLKRMLLMK